MFETHTDHNGVRITGLRRDHGTPSSALQLAAQHWDDLADEKAKWRDYRGEHVGVLNRKIRLYRDTATALRLQAETGVPHCACHRAPKSQWAELDQPVKLRR